MPKLKEVNDKALKGIIKNLGEGGCILALPEGKSNDSSSLLPLQGGVANMAMLTYLETG